MYSSTYKSDTPGLNGSTEAPWQGQADGILKLW